MIGRVSSLARKVARRLRGEMTLLTQRDAPIYRSPDAPELAANERELEALGLAVQDWRIDPARLAEFRRLHPFPPHYHGGVGSRVWDEKLLEHFAAWSLLDLGRPGAVYIDVAGASSPWATLLRRRGVEAHSVDLHVHPAYRALDYYVECDATRLPWPDASVDAMSLQCAFEMFVGEDDARFVREAWRVLKPGGSVLVVPLYLHTHACYYATPEYYDQRLGDPGAARYLWKGSWGVPASRKYSARTLLERVVAPARQLGFQETVRALRNAQAGGEGIYLHFILRLAKPA